MGEITNENSVRAQCTPRAEKHHNYWLFPQYWTNIQMCNAKFTHPGSKLSLLVQGMPKEIVLTE